MHTLTAWACAHGLRAIAALALAALTAALAAFNVQGWLAEGLGLLAFLAACFEAIGFVFAVLTEEAARARRPDRALVCFLILVGAAAFNTVGGHKAWEASQAPERETARLAAQEALDARREALQLAAARARAEIDRAPLPSPEAYTGRQEAARQTWELITAEPRRRLAAAERALEETPVVAPPPPPAVDERLVWAFLAFLEVAKALGLWAIGISAAGARASVAPLQGSPRPRPEQAPAFDASEAARRLVAMRRDRRPLAA